MIYAPQTYMTENDLLSQMKRLDSRGIRFFPMTTDEIILAERLCRKGILRQDGPRVRFSDRV